MKINFTNYISELNEAQMMTIQDLLNNFRKFLEQKHKQELRDTVLSEFPNSFQCAAHIEKGKKTGHTKVNHSN